MLTALGLDGTSERVYRALLAHPQDGVAALAARLACTDAEVRSALDLLSELSLVAPSAERDGQLRAVSPELGMEILMARQQAELAAQQSRIEASRAAAAQLIAEFADLRSESSTPDVEQLVGLDRIRDRLAGLTREVTTEVMTFAPDGAHTESALRAARPLNEELLDRGVTMRTVYLDSLRNHAPTVAHATWIAEHGGQVRTVPTLPTRMIIVDRSRAVIPVTSDDTAAGAVVLSGQGMLTALVALFEGVWSEARPLGESPRVEAGELSDVDRAALRLLAEGHTDDAIAKRLGVSPRTARRTASDLIDRLGARSRFQAGVRAVQLGWLPAQR